MTELNPQEFFGGVKEVSPSEFFGNAKPASKSQSQDDMSQRWARATADVKDFLTKAGKEYNQAEQEGWHHPIDYTTGMAKSILSGVVGLGGQAMEGVSGLGAGAKALLSHENPSKAFNAGMATGKHLMDKITPVVQKHLETHGKAQNAAQAALGIIPEAIQAAGDTGFDLTNSPVVGAATQAVGTLASILGVKGAIREPFAALRKAGEGPKLHDESTPVPEHLEVQTGNSGQFGTEATKIIKNPVVKPRARMVGGVLTQVPPPEKPRVRLVNGKLVPAKTPEELGAEARTNMAQVRAELNNPKPPAVKSAEDLLKEFESSTKKAIAGHTAELAADFRHANVQLRPYMQKFAREGLTTSHVLLDRIIQYSDQNGFINAYARHLRALIDNMPVEFKGLLYDEHKRPHEDWKGSYDRVTHNIEIKNDQEDHIHSILHEMTHAVTSKFIHDEPDHPLVKELQSLYEHASKEWEKLKAKNPEQLKDKSYYGLKDVHEFVAEALTNRKFQHFLANIRSISGDAKGMVSRNTLSGWSQFKGILRRILGLKPQEGGMLEHVLFNANNLMKEQAVKRGKSVDHPFQDFQAKHASSGDDDPVMFQHEGRLVTRDTVLHAFRMGAQAAEKIPGFPAFRTKMQDYYQQMLQTFNVEGKGPGAKQAAAVLAKNLSIQMREDTQNWHQAQVRRAFWQHRPKEAMDFILKFEKGGTFTDPVLNRAAEAYRAWNQEIFTKDAKLGIEYEPIDNYLYHVFVDGPGVQEFFNNRYGKRWGNPKFMKDRQFDFYEEAIKAGFKPKYSNPEDIMLARQHASNVAAMRVNTLQELESAGLAVEKKEGAVRPDGWMKTWRSPGGREYYIQDHAWAVLHNAFETKGLWDRRDIIGDSFRGFMSLKNLMVPIKFGLSLFHPIHVQTLDNAAAMTRATESLLAGVKSPSVWLKDMMRSQLYLDSVQNARTGARLMDLFRGKVSTEDLTDADRQALEFMSDGGFIPEISEQYRTTARQKFMDAVQARSATALFKAPFALVSLAQKPLFEVWIPRLKAASYLQDTLEAVKADPSLLDNPLKRQMRFRAIAKSVDNRYGEMAYSTLFWNRMAKDLAVGNMLSLGWNLGFLREYGGGALDVAKAIGSDGTLKSKAAAGNLHRGLFISFYTAQTMLYGGLLTYAFTGKAPSSMLDYVYPQVGTNPDGTPKRVSTMFYAREFYSIAKHIQNQGTIEGLKHLALSKSSGLIGLVGEFFSGSNSLGKEIYNPESPVFKQVEQRLWGVFKEMEPTALEVLGQGSKAVGLAFAGFNPAPKYVTDSPGVSYIKSIYDKYYQEKETPYLRAQQSQDMRELRDAFHKGDSTKQQEILQRMQKKYSLTGDEMGKLELKLSEPPEAGVINMFKRLTWQQQKNALDRMTPKERELFLPHANIEHLRYTYRPTTGDNE